jgi:hypothetical protein
MARARPNQLRRGTEWSSMVECEIHCDVANSRIKPRSPSRDCQLVFSRDSPVFPFVLVRQFIRSFAITRFQADVVRQNSMRHTCRAYVTLSHRYIPIRLKKTGQSLTLSDVMDWKGSQARWHFGEGQFIMAGHEFPLTCFRS